MKRTAQEAIYDEIKDMTPDEELAYWQNIHERFEKKSVKTHSARAT